MPGFLAIATDPSSARSCLICAASMLTGRPAAAFALAMSSRSLEHEVNSWQQRPHHHTVRLNDTEQCLLTSGVSMGRDGAAHGRSRTNVIAKCLRDARLD